MFWTVIYNWIVTMILLVASLTSVGYVIDVVAARRNKRKKKLSEGSRMRELTAWNAGEEKEEDA